MNFLKLKLKPEYRSFRDDVINDFYNPVLKCAVLYKRAVGFFSSSALSLISDGISGLIENGGKIQLIISPQLSVEDLKAIRYGFAIKEHDLPAAVEMEKKLLSAMMLKEGAVIPNISNIITEEDFYSEENRIIFRALLDIYNRGMPPDTLLVEDELIRTNELDRVNRQYLFSLMDLEFSTARAEAHADIIKEKAQLRQQINMESNFAEEQLNFLSNLIEMGRLEIKIAVIEDADNFGMFHEKLGLMYDTKGNVIAFSGSMNETANAFKNNYESIDVFTSWTSDVDRVKAKEAAFDSLWNDNERGVKVMPLTEVQVSPEFFTKVGTKFLTVQNNKAPNAEKVSSILQRTFERIQHAHNHSGEMTGVTTGLGDLNKVTNGLQNSDLIILAARPSMGKTALALNIAVNAVMKKTPVLVFSLEMSKEQLGYRLLSMESKMNSQYLNTGNFSENNMEDLLHALDELSPLNLFVDDTAGLTLAELQARAKWLKQEKDLGLIVVDYIQLIQGNKEFRGNRVQEVSEISRGLKTLARELNIPVLAVSQLSRNVEMRADKQPQLSDLRESGSLEQDADIVMFLYRDEYYNRDDTDNQNIAKLIIAKNRNGPTTSICLQFNKEIMHFGDLIRAE